MFAPDPTITGDYWQDSPGNDDLAGPVPLEEAPTTLPRQHGPARSEPHSPRAPLLPREARDVRPAPSPRREPGAPGQREAAPSPETTQQSDRSVPTPPARPVHRQRTLPGRISAGSAALRSEARVARTRVDQEPEMEPRVKRSHRVEGDTSRPRSKRSPVIEGGKPGPLTDPGPSRPVERGASDSAPGDTVMSRVGRLVPAFPASASTRSRSDERTKTPESPHTAPTIRVTIGRVDVRAIVSPAPPSAKPPRPKPLLTLEDYLKQRNGGRR